MRLKTLALNPYIHMALLALLVFATFNRTMGAYFLADDFGEVAYVSRIAGGDLGMLWANFTGNFMQISGMAVWRPWLLISLLFDFLIWGAKPFGFYITNMLSYTGLCLALYLFVRNLTRDWCPTRAGLAAFVSALIFGVNPLHCEATTFVVGRVDIICALFYLVCLNLFILSMRAEPKKRKALTILSVMAFWLAMWTKEMSIGAPVLAFVIALLWGQPALDFKKSLRISAPLLISLIVYFILRYLALGTFLGGYTQGIGDAQAAGALSRWLDGDTLRRLFFPLALSIYSSNHIFQFILALIYILLTTLLLLRAGSLSLPARWVIFIPIWLVTALAPIYKLWGIGYELEGARFVFLATMPLASFFPILLFAPHSSGTATKSWGESIFRRAFAALSLIGLLSLALIYSKIAGRINLDWVHAGKEVREFTEKSRELASQSGTHDVIVLGIPKRHGAAEMILNGTTFKILLAPPFTKAAPGGDHLLTFDPIIFGNADYINASRFKDCVAKPGTTIKIWHSDDRCFKSVLLAPGKSPLPQLSLPPSTSNGFLHTYGHELFDHSSTTASSASSTSSSTNSNRDTSSAIDHITAGDGIYFDNLNLSPLDADFLEVTLTGLEAPSDRPIAISASWKDDDPERKYCVSRTFLSAKPLEQKVYLRLSHNYRWYAQDTIHVIFLELPPHTKVAVHQVKLLRASEICPQLSLTVAGQAAKTISTLGLYPISASSQIDVKVALPEALQKGQVLLEISKPNAFFENFSESDQAAAVQAIRAKPGAAVVNFTLPQLKEGSNYQIRARATSGAGLPIGEASDPLLVRIN
jgi:hypothetical protein